MADGQIRIVTENPWDISLAQSVQARTEKAIPKLVGRLDDGRTVARTTDGRYFIQVADGVVAPNSLASGSDALISANRARSAALREQHAEILGAWQRYKNRGGELSLPAWKKKYDVLQANRARGRWAESFGQPGQVYNTPYGRRIVDNAPAIEIKSGYASRTKFIRWQLVKDMWLRRNVPGYNPVWRFVVDAPSQPLLRHLETMGIPYQLPGQF